MLIIGNEPPPFHLRFQAARYAAANAPINAPILSDCCASSQTCTNPTPLSRCASGVSHSVRLVIDKNRQLKRATIDGKPIDPKAQYRVVTNDYVVQGNDGMPAFKEGTQLVAPQSEENNVRYVMMDYFREQMKAGKTVCGKREGRITIE